MTDLTNIFARSIKDLTLLPQLPDDLTVLNQVKIPVGNLPVGLNGCEALSIQQLRTLVYSTLNQDIRDIEQKVDSKLAETQALVDSKLLETQTTVESQLSETQTIVDSKLLVTKTTVESQLSENKTYTNQALSQLSTAANKFYPTLAEANASIASLAVNQPVTIGEVANGGLWYKATAGATSLTKSAYDPLTQAKLSAASLSVIGDYLTDESKREKASLSESSTKYLIVKAIKKVAITNPISGKKYKIGSVFKNSNLGSRIGISDDTGVISAIDIPVETVVSGLQWYSLTGIRNAKVLIDWDVLPSAVIQSNLDLFYNNDKYFQEYSLTTSIAQNTVIIDSIKPALLPDWVVTSQANAI
ncbi:MAG: hypothetical protein B7Z24_07360, partial [Pseudomonadales bacterium 32-42-5]